MKCPRCGIHEIMDLKIEQCIECDIEDDPWRDEE